MNHPTLTLKLVIKYSKVFPHDELTPQEILAPYGKKLTMKMTSVLNSMLQRDLTELPQQITSWFGHEGPLGGKVMQLIFDGYRQEIRDGAKLSLVNHYSNLVMNIIAKQLDEVDENIPMDVGQSHLDFFRAYLKVNEEFLTKQDNIAVTMPEEMHGMEKVTWMSTGSVISYYDFSYMDRLSSLIQLVKAMYCFEFIESYNPQLYQFFLAAKKITGFKEYVVKMLPLTKLCYTDLITFDGSSQENREFLELFNHQVDVLENEENTARFDFLAIRNKPIFSLGENEFVILSRAMVVNKIYSSVYWDCKALLADHVELGISDNRFRSDFTTDFSEGYLVYKLMQKAYGNKSCKQFSGAEMKAHMQHSEPDYYIRNGNKVSIYEVKDSFIAGKVKQSFDVVRIREDIEKKYYKHNNSEKAIKQLITRVRFSLNMEYPFDKIYKPNKLRFYPILIVYDINLTVPGIESLMADWFYTERELLVEEMMVKGIEGFHIHDMVILHIDALVLLSEYIRAGRMQMEDLIERHLARRRDLLKPQQNKTFEELKARVLNSYLSFNHHVMSLIQQLPPKNRIMASEFKIFAETER